jgi:hypothetical protein
MSTCEKSNRHQNHQIWPSKRVLQEPPKIRIYKKTWESEKSGDKSPHSKNFAIILETAVQDDKVMQDFELESLSMGVDHSQTVKAIPIRRDYSSKDCVNLSSSTAVSRIIRSLPKQGCSRRANPGRLDCPLRSYAR